tara:strand:- start:993 stop:1169 length:177 start_codon:yes stop_codon:yes gene_type:complete
LGVQVSQRAPNKGDNMEFFEIMLSLGIVVLCVYCIGYISGSEATREIYNPTIRKKDIE